MRNSKTGFGHTCFHFIHKKNLLVHSIMKNLIELHIFTHQTLFGKIIIFHRSIFAYQIKHYFVITYTYNDKVLVKKTKLIRKY